MLRRRSARIPSSLTSLKKKLIDTEDLQDILLILEENILERNLEIAGLKDWTGSPRPKTSMDLDEKNLFLNVFLLPKTSKKKKARYVAILLNEGADPNHRDENGLTPLMHACFIGADRAAKELIMWKDTDLYAKDNNGKTAVMYAAGEGHHKILKYYCKALRKEQKHGNDVELLEARTIRGETAKDLAAAGGYTECVEIIESERSRRMRSVGRKVSGGAIAGRMSPLRAKLKPVARAGSFDSLFNDDHQEDSLVEDKWSNHKSHQYYLKYGDKHAEIGNDNGASSSKHDNLPDVAKPVALEAELVSRERLSDRIRSIFLRKQGAYRPSTSADPITPSAANKGSPVRMRRSKTSYEQRFNSPLEIPVEPSVVVKTNNSTDVNLRPKDVTTSGNKRNIVLPPIKPLKQSKSDLTS